MKSSTHINWTNTLFLILTPIVGILGTIAIVTMGLLSWKTAVLTAILIVFVGLSTTAGYHRLFSHSTYKAAWPVRLYFILFGAGSFEGSVLEWCTDHRNHHLHTDTKQDPYNINQGFWHAHMGWLFTLDITKRDFTNVEDLKQDPLVRFQHRFFVPLAIFMGFILPMLIASLWGDMWGGLIIAGFLRVTATHHITFSINSFTHMFGKKTYSDRTSARDNWLTAILTMGEGYHNFHHQFPLDYRNGIRFYHFDPTKWLIRALSYFRLAYDLKRVGDHRIVHYRINMDRDRLTNTKPSTHKTLQQLYQSIVNTLTRIDKSETAHKELKASKTHYILDRMSEYRKTAKAYCNEISKAKSDLKYLLKSWKSLVNDLS